MFFFFFDWILFRKLRGGNFVGLFWFSYEIWRISIRPNNKSKNKKNKRRAVLSACLGKFHKSWPLKRSGFFANSMYLYCFPASFVFVYVFLFFIFLKCRYFYLTFSTAVLTVTACWHLQRRRWQIKRWRFVRTVSCVHNGLAFNGQTRNLRRFTVIN